MGSAQISPISVQVVVALNVTARNRSVAASSSNRSEVGLLYYFPVISFRQIVIHRKIQKNDKVRSAC